MDLQVTPKPINSFGLLIGNGLTGIAGLCILGYGLYAGDKKSTWIGTGVVGAAAAVWLARETLWPV